MSYRSRQLACVSTHSFSPVLRRMTSHRDRHSPPPPHTHSRVRVCLSWTHEMKTIDFHNDSFTPEGCDPTTAVNHAVTVGAGTQFADLYPVAEAHGRIVNGGTCTSVGIAGCTLGGCFGTFSQSLGSSADNLLQARVVLADGTIATVSECSHRDLFYALRGGGGGHAVVTDLTYRSYPSPTTITEVSWCVYPPFFTRICIGQ
jgi:hypothetical protein